MAMTTIPAVATDDLDLLLMLGSDIKYLHRVKGLAARTTSSNTVNETGTLCYRMPDLYFKRPKKPYAKRTVMRENIESSQHQNLASPMHNVP